jgi:hypothetical protein
MYFSEKYSIFFLDIFFHFLPINKNCFFFFFQKYIQFFSRHLLSFLIPLKNVGDPYAPPCTKSPNERIRETINMFFLTSVLIL